MTCFEELLVQQAKASSHPKKRTHEPSSSSRALFQDRADLRNSSRAVTFDPVVDTHIIDDHTTGDNTTGDDNTTTTQAVQTEIADGAVRYDLN